MLQSNGKNYAGGENHVEVPDLCLTPHRYVEGHHADRPVGFGRKVFAGHFHIFRLTI
jgi:hypothetical protein